jgi:exodeoxyribonuclease-3
MRVATLNVNGIRSSLKKGLESFLKSLNLDVIFLQEIRALESDWPSSDFLSDYFRVFAPACQKGYSGVATFAKKPITTVRKESPLLSLNNEGRLLDIESGGFRLVNVYWPSGAALEERQKLKIAYLKDFQAYWRYHQSALPTILGGDFNTTRTDRDLKNARGNKEKPGCTTEERALLQDFLDHSRLQDSFRVLYSEKEYDERGYTWWSFRGQAFAKNVGWRIDYLLVSENLSDKIVTAQVLKYPQVADHALYMIEIKTDY